MRQPSASLQATSSQSAALNTVFGFRSLLERALTPKKQRQPLRVFDFDDTIAETDAAIGVMRGGKRVQSLSSLRFKDYILQPGEAFDFSAADEVRNPKPIGAVLKVMRTVIAQGKPTVILTGRAVAHTVAHWLGSIGIDIPVITVGGPGTSHHSIAQAKYEWLRDAIGRGYDDIEFWDDNALNIQYAKRLKAQFPHVRLRLRHVKYKPRARAVHEGVGKEYVLWGIPKGETDALHAQVLYTQGKTPADVERVKRLAAREGWHSFRVQVLDMGGGWDARAAFAGAVRKRK